MRIQNRLYEVLADKFVSWFAFALNLAAAGKWGLKKGFMSEGRRDAAGDRPNPTTQSGTGLGERRDRPKPEFMGEGGKRGKKGKKKEKKPSSQRETESTLQKIQPK